MAMTLVEAIQHCEEVAKEQESHGYCDRSLCVIMDVNNATCDECEAIKCRECASEHRQLAEWLKELKAYKDARAEINQALYDDARGEQNDYERGRKSGIFLCESIISVKLGESSSENPNTCGDVISRQAVMEHYSTGEIANCHHISRNNLLDFIEQLPSVTPQQRTGRCKDCKYFEYDSVAKVDGIPLIVAHEICKRWGDGCKSKEDGYCFLFEPKMQEVEE